MKVSARHECQKESMIKILSCSNMRLCLANETPRLFMLSVECGKGTKGRQCAKVENSNFLSLQEQRMKTNASFIRILDIDCTNRDMTIS
jgi:hypothetical protein